MSEAMAFLLIGVATAIFGCAIFGCGGSQDTGSTSSNESLDHAALLSGRAPDDEANQPRKGSRPPSVRERQVIARLARAAAHLRHLKFRHNFNIQIQTQEAVQEQLLADLDFEELESSRRLYEALGLLPKNIDLRALLQDVLGEQVVGFYDSRGKNLVVRDNVMAQFAAAKTSELELDYAEMVLVHELVHALQDQHFDLEALLKKNQRSDGANAVRALVEGDATLAMVAFLAQRLGVDLQTLLKSAFQQNAKALQISTGALERAPAIVRITLIAPYIHGLGFVSAMHQQGLWDAVDAAYRVLPSTSEEILHPSMYPRSGPPPSCKLRLPPHFRLKTVREDTLGELELAVYLGQTASEEINLEAATGWNGDWPQPFQENHASPPVPDITATNRLQESYGFVWCVCWDTTADLAEALTALQTLPNPPEHRQQKNSLLLVKMQSSTEKEQILETFRKRGCQ